MSTTALRAAATGNPADIKNAGAVAGKDLKPKDLVKSMLEQNKHIIAQALPKHMNPERLMRVAITSVTSNPKLLECYVPTLIGGIIQCSQMGLEPNTVLGHAYLIPFNNKKKNRTDAQVIIGYKGLIDLARRSGQIVSIAAHAVRQNDKFIFEYGLNEKLSHIPAEGDRGEITHFYAVAHMKDGGHAFEVMTSAAVMKIRNAGQGKHNPVWSDHYEEMGRKTAIRRLAKYLPLSVEMATAVAMEDASERGAQLDLETVLTGDFVVEDEGQGGGDGDADGAGGEQQQQQNGGTGGGAIDPAQVLKDVTALCQQSIASKDANVASLKIDDAADMARSLTGTNKDAADKELAAAREALQKRT